MRMYTRCEAWEKEMLFERVTRRGATEATPKVERAGRGMTGILLVWAQFHIACVRVHSSFS